MHPTDACRFEILIPGEQRYYLKAANSQERQRWVIALGSCKAGINDVDEFQKMRESFFLNIIYNNNHSRVGFLPTSFGKHVQLSN